MARFTKAEQQESRDALCDLLGKATQRNGKPVIYTVLRSISASGMTRRISAYVIVDGVPEGLSWDYDRAHGRMADDKSSHWANKVGGCGMDMGFHLAGNIAATAGLNHGAFIQEWI